MSRRSVRLPVAFPIVVVLALAFAGPVHAESGRYNVHVSGMAPFPVAGEVAFDWQLARPIALEVAAGGGLLSDFGQSSDGIFFATIGARLRLADDESGYLDEGGSIAGHFWVASHVGFFVTSVTPGLLLDISTGYDFSIVAPVSIGPFVRAGVGIADVIAPFFAGGINLSIEIEPLREPVLDSDGDGVHDRADLCPDTPPGRAVDAVGCGDEDRDGIRDDLDRCPGTPEGERVNAVGCGDADRDGVHDDMDACPDTPSGSDVDARGCIILPPALVLEGITFDYDSAVIQPSSETALMRALQLLRDNPDTRVEIGGHTDDVGSRSYNLDLSRQRAQAVFEWLVAHGLDAGRLEVRGYGPSQPRVPNTDDASRARNRRIELHPIGR